MPVRRQRVLLVFGTRPDAIKMAPVYRALLADCEGFEPMCCVTGQHREMLDQALAIFGISPEFDLRLMRERQHLSDLSASILSGLRPVLTEVSPDLVLVQGDTTTIAMASLAAFYDGTPVGHVEAGLRTNDLASPFPEELNRRLTGLMAKWHFAPTSLARDNLLREGCDPASILLSGNTVVDSVQLMLEQLETDPKSRQAADDCLDAVLPFDWRTERFVLVTCHRRESQDGGISAICAALAHLAAVFPEIHFVLPVHPSPAVRHAVHSSLSSIGGIHLIDPLPYGAFIRALRRCLFVLTDSGGVQEEAPSAGKRVVVMREITERQEAGDAGHSVLVGTDPKRIAVAVSRLLNELEPQSGGLSHSNPFGDGAAARRIAEFLKARWRYTQNQRVPLAELSTVGR